MKITAPKERTSGILLHVTSLPSPYGIGDLGPAAYRFADFLVQAKQSLWQVLPVTYTHQSHGNSPYSCISAFAGNPLLISPELLVADGLLSKEEAAPDPALPRDRVDYTAVIPAKMRLLETAYEHFRDRAGTDGEYRRFCEEQGAWLDDFSLFATVRADFKGEIWRLWPRELRERKAEALDAARERYRDKIEREKFFQYLFFKQWHALKKYCNERGVRIIGDIPFYVNYDSADVWTNPSLFKLDRDKKPLFVSGVPPDYFSSTGQLWGNPVYNWDRLKRAGYPWWTERLAMNFSLFDLVRIDHFRGFSAYWEVPVAETTAVNGKWVTVPGADFFTVMRKKFGSLPIIAEDLGTITPDVRELIAQFDFPGMKVLLFAFGDDFPRGIYLPHLYERNCVVYTGTHDNNTVKGWFEGEASQEQRDRLCWYAGRNVGPPDAPDVFVRLALLSPAEIALIPFQDIVGLGAGSRMNKPATMDGNWQWRLVPEQLSDEVAGWLGSRTSLYGRDPREPA